MACTLRWIVSTSASAIHAAEALARELPVVDAGLGEALRESVEQLTGVIGNAALPDTIWTHLAALAAGVHVNRELADVALTKTLGASTRQRSLVEPLAAAITRLEHAYNAHAPCSNDDLELRSGPLREQWEARGPGLLAQLGRSTEPDLLVPQADVVLVHPTLGGAGAAHLAYNSVRIEAVLANPHQALPEVVRLAWLIGQLNHDLPALQGHLRREQVASLGALALIPPTLAAAETVELTSYDRNTLCLALTAWRVAAGQAEPLAQTLTEWWQVYEETRPQWAVALAALNRMLGEPQ